MISRAAPWTARLPVTAAENPFRLKLDPAPVIVRLPTIAAVLLRLAGALTIRPRRLPCT